MWKWMLILSCVSFFGSASAETKVLAFAGSTREGSLNKKLVLEAAAEARKLGAKVTVIDFKDYPVPLYDADVEAHQGMPANAKRVRDLMVDSQVIMIASPEYNGSLSGTLKNMIDWVSRSEEKGPSRQAFLGKKFAIMSSSPGKGGGTNGLAHLRSIIENIGGTVVSQQVSVPNGNEAFDSKGHLKNPKTQAELEQLVKAAISPI